MVNERYASRLSFPFSNPRAERKVESGRSRSLKLVSFSLLLSSLNAQDIVRRRAVSDLLGFESEGGLDRTRPWEETMREKWEKDPVELDASFPFFQNASRKLSQHFLGSILTLRTSAVTLNPQICQR